MVKYNDVNLCDRGVLVILVERDLLVLRVSLDKMAKMVQLDPQGLKVHRYRHCC